MAFWGGSRCSLHVFLYSFYTVRGIETIFPLIFCSSLADWSDCCYGMCCGTKGAENQKPSDLLERPLSVHVLFSPSPPFSPHPKLVSPLPSPLSDSLFLSVRLLYFEMMPCAGTLSSLFPLFLTYTPIQTHVHSNNTGSCMHRFTHTHALTNWNVCESPSGYLCNLHLKLVRGQEANRPRRLNANSGGAGWLPG